MAAARLKAKGEPAQLAEHAFYRMIDAQCADLCVLYRHWPAQTVREVLEARDRLARRRVPGGDADQALVAVYRAYGGAAKVPGVVRRRMRAYLDERLGRPPWPARDLGEDLDEPAIVRKGRRQRRGTTAP